MTHIVTENFFTGKNRKKEGIEKESPFLRQGGSEIPSPIAKLCIHMLFTVRITDSFLLW